MADAVSAAFGLAVRAVRTLSSDHDGTVVLLEWAGEPPAGARWARHVAGAERALEAWRDGPAPRTPWSRSGWFDQAVVWLDEQIASLGERRTGPVVTLRHWSISAILQAPTDRGGVVLKQGLACWEREPQVLQVMAPTCTGVPTVLAHDGSRWLARPFPRPAYEADYDALRLSVVAHLGSIQRALVGRRDDVLAASAPDAGLHALANRAFVLADEVPDLAAHFGGFSRCLEALDALDLPASITHGDFHPWNSLVDGGEPFIFDWTDCSWSQPIFDLAVWLERADRSAHASVIAAWADGFEVDPALARIAWTVAEPLGQLHYAWNYRSLVAELTGSEREVWHPMVEHWCRNAIESLDSEH